MEKSINYEQISLLGMELFRKNNESFMTSKLSPIMSRIFKAANKNIKNETTENECYMKSGILPNKIFYIYSDKIKTKLLDVVFFNGETCIWLYTNTIINKIDERPVVTIIELYSILVQIFMQRTCDEYFINEEDDLISIIMSIRLIKFLHETYGALDIDDCMKRIKSVVLFCFTNDSVDKFIEDVLENCDNVNYFKNREYLDSYLLLETPTESVGDDNGTEEA